jgi:hypothetical protein
LFVVDEDDFFVTMVGEEDVDELLDEFADEEMLVSILGGGGEDAREGGMDLDW